MINPESKEWLKEELKIYQKDLKLSYSRDFILTYIKPKNDFSYAPVFSRHWGISLKIGTKEACLLEFEKMNSKSSLIETETATAYPKGQFFELIKIREDEYLLGFVEKPLSKYPLANPGITLSEKAPSRAYLKIKEVISVANLNFNPNENVIEFGSSPGGAVFALLENGQNVIGVDTGKMHEACLNHPNYKHISKSIQEVLLSDFEVNYKLDWLLSDMNLSPVAVFSELEKFFERTKIKPQKGIVLTLKMTKKDLVRSFNGLEKKMEKLGYRVSFMSQLSQHHTEFCMVGLAQNKR